MDKINLRPRGDQARPTHCDADRASVCGWPNSIYSQLLTDKLSLYYIFRDFADVFFPCNFWIGEFEGQKTLVSLPPSPTSLANPSLQTNLDNPLVSEALTAWEQLQTVLESQNIAWVAAKNTKLHTSQESATKSAVLTKGSSLPAAPEVYQLLQKKEAQYLLSTLITAPVTIGENNRLSETGATAEVGTRATAKTAETGIVDETGATLGANITSELQPSAAPTPHPMQTSTCIHTETIQLENLLDYLPVDTIGQAVSRETILTDFEVKMKVHIRKTAQAPAAIINGGDALDSYMASTLVKMAQRLVFAPDLVFHLCQSSDGWKIIKIVTGGCSPIQVKPAEIVLSDAFAAPLLPLNIRRPCNYFDKCSANWFGLQTRCKAWPKQIMDRIVNKWGWQGYMYRDWLRGLFSDLRERDSEFSWRQRLWANSKGFYSYRLRQYGINPSNYQEFMSDRDYKWLRQINNEYRKWLRNKLSFYYVLAAYQEYLPTYYFVSLQLQSLNQYDQNCQFKPTRQVLFDVATGQVQTAEDVLACLHKVKCLALKPCVSVHGKGFKKLEEIDGCYFLNNQVYSEADLIAYLNNPGADYIISEFTQVHDFIGKMYNKSASSLRLMVVNERGAGAQILAAYLRLGNDRSGAVDNIMQGGISVLLDPTNGQIIKAESLARHRFTPITHHPDTQIPICGILPNWTSMCSKIIEIANYLAPIEYMGVDVVLTEAGFKILEINMHQELHKYPDYPLAVKTYLKRKLHFKRQLYNKS